MKTIQKFNLILAILGFFLATTNAQQLELNKIEKEPDYLRLDGPRVGVTKLWGSVAKNAEQIGLRPYTTQFGWQFEKRLFYGTNGTAGLVEFVPLIAGLEQNKFLPSLSLLVGMRSKEGFEVGMGPNLAVTGVGMVFAAGGTIKTGGGFFIPVNLVYVPSKDGGRISLMTGFNIRKRQ